MKLYTTPKSANGVKALAAFYHLDIPVEVVIVDVYAGAGRNPAYLKVNPQGKVPTLVDGELVLWESNAILQYIADTRGQLWAEDAVGRADINRWLFWESAHWQPVLSTILTPMVVWKLGLGLQPAKALDWSGVTQQLGLLEDHLSDRDFLVGERLTIADLSIAAMLIYANVLPDGYPALKRWRSRVAGLEAWQRALAGSPWVSPG